MLSRRAALVLLATGCLAPAPVAAQRDKPVHLGILSMTSGLDSVPLRTLKQRLAALGHVEGRTLTLETCRSNSRRRSSS